MFWFQQDSVKFIEKKIKKENKILFIGWTSHQFCERVDKFKHVSRGLFS